MYYTERFNSYSHLTGALFALFGAVVLIVLAARQADAWKIISFAIYGTTLVFLYAASTLYHSTRGRLKQVFRKLDHGAIYLLIAGTYTPFTLVTLHGPWGWSLFGFVWGLAALGIAQEYLFAKDGRVTSLVIYLLMGWCSVIAMEPLIEALSLAGFIWLAIGGAVYTAGMVFYIYDERFTHWHGIWHLFVIAGSSIHFYAILTYVARRHSI